jgi:hypothetical protein
MLASSFLSSGEPREVPLRGQVTSESLPITMIAPAEGHPAPHTPSAGRTMAIDRRGSYANKDRLGAASAAKKAQIERARAIAEDPARLSQIEARSEIIAARNTRIAERERVRREV